MLSLAAAMITIAAPFIGMSPAFAGVGISPVPDFPTTVTVGVPFTARLNLINTSTPPESSVPVVVSNITLVPACANNNLNCTGGVDPGVFALSSTGVGGSACAGTTFTITESSPGSGLYNFTPSTPVLLSAGQTCTVDFTATAVKAPSIDTSPGTPGLQIRQVATATVTSTNPVFGSTDANASDATTVALAPTSITTNVLPKSVVVGQSVQDTATVTGLVSPTPASNVDFVAYSDAACTMAAFISNDSPVNPVTGVATSAVFTPTAPGTYRFIATYSGDANNLPSGPTACADPAEVVVVSQATPTLVTSATPDPAPLGATINDTATVSGGFNPTGTITFHLYRDPACAVEIFTSTNPLVAGPGVPFTTATATSSGFTVNQAGTYRWVATYSGDVNNAPAGPTACLDPAEDVLVNRASPTIATVADPNAAQIGNVVRDTATVSGGFSPTGTVLFQLFSDAACTVQVFSSTNPLVPGAPATATSDPFNIPAAGTFHWVATYSGDANNNPAGPTACADPLEAVTVPKAQPTISTTAAPQTATVGGQLTDTANVAAGASPTGTVFFQLFSDAACTVPVFSSTNPLDPVTHTATSGPFTVTAPGTYHWVATYSGDANNTPAGPTPCADLNEMVTVAKASPTIATVAAPAAAGIGQQVRDTAQISGGSNPTGTVTFRLYSDAACTVQVFTSTNPVVAGTPATSMSDPFTTVAAGTYHWTATYSGDANNNAAGPTACLDPAEQLVVSPSAPAIATTASPTVPVGGVVFDTATVSGGSNPTGTVTFTLFSDAACTVSVFTSTNPLSGAHTAQSGNFPTTAPGTYHWVATYSGDANNLPAGPTACADPAEQVVVSQATPTITTTASPTVTVGGTIFDTATVSGGNNPTGTVTFNLFGPGDTTCTTSIFTSTTSLNGAHVAQSGNFTANSPGTYRWVARYNGDVNNAASGPTACADPAEQVVVGQASPAITTRASMPVVLGNPINDVATVTGLVNPTAAGTVTFTVFGPNNATCTGPAVFTSTVPVDQMSGVATSGNFTPTAPGTYRFIARYNGDVNNAAAGPTACADPLESVVVSPGNPTIMTQASAAVPVGGQITDTASLGGGVAPTGTITFTLFGPNNATCTGAPVFTSTVPVNGNGSYPSAPFTTTAAGTYRWIAAYSGDANNAPAGPTACADAAEQANANKLSPTLVTTASAGSVGGQVFDTATISGGLNPTGTVTFNLFNTETCTGTPIFTSTRPVMGNGNVTSTSFILPTVGIYHFVATYSGDANNNAAGPTACLDPAETVGVGRLAITLTTQASAATTVGGTISDTATFAGGFGATGTITFNLYGPNDATCTGTPAFTSTVPVNGDGTYPSGSFTPTAAGTYRWVASYSGDVNNAPATTPCADPNEQVVVGGLPLIMVDKTATPLSLPVPGGTFTFNVVVTNTGPVPLTIRSLTDNIYGDLTTRTGSTCTTAIGTVLQPAGTYSCHFTGDFTGPSGASQTDIVTVTGTDAANHTVTDTDDAVVTITPVPPSITTTKTATPPSLPEPGGTFTFNYSVTNTGPEAVTVTSIVDNVYGDLNGKGTCAVGAVLAANGGTYRCSFTGNFFGDAGAAQTDTITTTAVDAGGVTVTSQAMATVTITDVPPTIAIVKTPDPVSRPEPGGTFRFTVKVTNTSFEPVTITSLVDDIYGDLNGRGSCAIGTVLAANGGSYSCAFDGEFHGKAGDSQTDTVTVIGKDNDNTTVTAQAKATVTLTPVNTPPVAPPVIPVTPAPVIQPTPQVLVRTGVDLRGPGRLAGILLLVGITLLAATHWFGEGGPGLVPAGPGGSPGPRGGGGFGGGHWFGGARVEPPRGPFGGAGGTTVLDPPPADEPDQPDEPDETAWDAWVADPAAVAPAQPAAVAPPERVPVALPEPAADAWVVARVPVAPAQPADVAPPEPAAEILVPTVVQVRRTAGLDAAALDAAEALEAPARPPAPAPGRRRARNPRRF